MMSNDDDTSLSFDDVEQAGPAVTPLDFPTPRVQYAKYIVEVQVRDHLSGRICEGRHAIVPLPACDRAYMFRKKLAKSTYGSVRLCTVLRRLEGLGETPWETTDEFVTVKASSWSRILQLRGRQLEDPIKEVAALQHVGNYHPNVLGCLEVLEDDDYLYTVMPYCAGGDLYGKLAGNKQTTTIRPDEHQVRIWFRQLLQGLFHLQQKGVCHRDLALENLLLDEKDNLVLVDFGLALRVPYTDASNFDAVADISEGIHRRLILAQGQGGSLTYLAPEIIEREDAFDGFAVDLWSAGVILFIMLVGMAPFKWAHPSDKRFAEISSKGQLRELVRNSNIPLSDRVCDLLQGMLWRDPRKRMTLSQVWNHPWVLNNLKEETEPILSSKEQPNGKRSVRFQPRNGAASAAPPMMPRPCERERVMSF